MIAFAAAKLNLGLQITGRRADGYHLLESLFLPIGLADILEIIPLEGGATSDSLHVLGDIDTGRQEDNLVLRAVRAMREHYDFPCVDITLKKLIPSGAGMGGGSSDASATLKLLRQLFSLPATDEELEAIALRLGADCPFFIKNSPRLVRGIGEVFAPAPRLELEGYSLLVLKPQVHSSTAEAFRGLKGIGGHAESVEDILTHYPISAWRERLHNDFEDSLFPLYPELAQLKQMLYDLGAVYASMTGSGAALYGIFEEAIPRQGLQAYFSQHSAELFVWQGRL